MSLELAIQEEMKVAMRNKDKRTLEALRAVKSAILLAKTEKAGIETLDADTEIKLLQKLVKQRKESAAIFTEQNRPELAEEETFQAEVIEKFLPEQMSNEALLAFLQDLIKQVGATGPGDMGKVMGAASKALSGKADGKTISEVVRKLLTS
jgi:uncharacterized protein YqeY